MKDQTSKLRFYSFGIVTKDKVEGENVITVHPIEDLPLVQGNINQWSIDYNHTVKDINGKETKINESLSATLEAKWLPFSVSNRASAPDVYRNETVLLFQYADVEDIFWTDIFFEPGLRKQETVYYIYSNVKEHNEVMNKDNSYWVLVDTRNKKIQLHTTMNDGEPCEYDISLDTGAGVFVLQDSKGNSFLLDSVNGTLTGNMNNQVTMTVPLTKWKGDIELDGNLKVNQTLEVIQETTLNNGLNITNGSGATISGTITGDATLDIKDITASGNISAVGTVSGSNI